ncbi:type I polyketide synthase [Mycolicibacterium litorale]|uniref:type I polyketide synthase n=1 Tax=Mycolicibacterium litorale TaxID=758802 RepID=UPI00399FFD8C
MTNLAALASQLSPKARELLMQELVRAGTAPPTDSGTVEPIAVVGIGCRFPGGVAGPESLWQLLANGVDAITEVPADRWDVDAYYDPDPGAPGRMTTRWGGFISDAGGFDADFFGIAPREAEAMDPQQRLLLEVAWEALEHSGIRPDSLSGTRTGVMVGLSTWDYAIVNIERHAQIDAYLSTGIPHSTAVGRLSYLMGLRGPAVAVDTACSSSLVAIHLACQSLRLGESDMVLAGGSQLNLSPFTSIALSKWSALSPEGRCKTFDARADGFVRGEGCGVVVLKRLSDALRDGNRVLAVVRGSAVNQDGRSNGITAPNALAQRDVINDALRSGGVEAASVNYVEAHGTGTILGDPIEFEALATTYGVGQASCALGAVKTNLGHLEAAAGVAGFIKAVLTVQRGQIPPNLHFTRLNPSIDASATRFVFPSRLGPWPDEAGLRRAGVSSFGLAGTNAHVVVEQAPVTEPAVTVDDPRVTTLVVSGKTPKRIGAMAGVLADWMSAAGTSVPLADVAHTLNHHRARHTKYATVSARDRTQAIAGLKALAAGRPAEGVNGSVAASGDSGAVFVYSGQGSQWAGMGRRLLTDEPAFAAAVAALEPTFSARVGFSLQDVIARGEAVDGDARVQPVIMGLQLALTELWRSYGVTPRAVLGHSMGEVTAAVVAGALTADQGLRVIAVRSQLMGRLAGQGAVALLEMDADETAALIADHAQVSLAVYSSPRQTVIAGPPTDIDTLIAVVQGRGRFAKRVNMQVASHNALMDPILPELRGALADLTPTAPVIPFISTVQNTTQPVLDAEYWVANVREPVRLSQAITAAADRRLPFVEVSPHPTLAYAITETLEHCQPSRRPVVTATMSRGKDQTLFFHSQLAALGIASPENGSRGLVDIPTTPWEHTKYWVPDRAAASAPSDRHALLGAHIAIPTGDGHVWQADAGSDVLPWLADYRVHDHVLMPTAGFAEMVLAAAAEAFGQPAHTLCIDQLTVDQMLPIEGHTPVTTQSVTLADNRIRVEIHSRSATGTWRRHAVAHVEKRSDDPVTQRLDTPPLESLGTALSPAEFYANHQLGTAFRALTRIVRLHKGVSEVQIDLPDEAPGYPGCAIHPVMLDAALQSLLAAMPDGVATPSEAGTYLTESFGTLRLFRETGRHARCRSEIVGVDEDGATRLGKVTLTDETGTSTAEITDVRLRRVERAAIPLPLSHKVFETTWIEDPIPAESTTDVPSGTWLVLGDGAAGRAQADAFADGWRSPSHRVITADLADDSALPGAFADTASDPDHPPVGVVVFLEDHALEGEDQDAALHHARDSIWSIAAVLRTVLAGWHGRSPRLWLMTRRGLAVGEHEPGDPGIGALRGLIRVLAYEHPELRTTLVDLGAEDAASVLDAELRAAGKDDVIAWREGQRFVERLSRATLGSPVKDKVVRPGGAYIVTGGVGGLGLVVARWLVDRGAGRVVLNSRSEPSDERAQVIDDLQERAEIVLVRGDIADQHLADRLVATAEATGRDLCGVAHLAGVLDDSLLVTMTRESLDRVWSAKTAGALRLHRATAERSLDWWLAFSSTSALLGSPGQSAYASANAWVDALVRWRRAAGLPATAINWGPWSDVGMARSLANSAVDPITPSEGTEALEVLLATDRANTGLARLRTERALTAFPEILELGYFAHLLEELDVSGGGDTWAGPEALRELSPDEAERILADRVRSRVAAIMGYADESALDVAAPLITMGMDSLMAVRIRRAASADFGIEPPVALLLQGASLNDVAADLLRQLGFAGHDSPAVDAVRDRANQRAAARQLAATRRKRGQRA